MTRLYRVMRKSLRDRRFQEAFPQKWASRTLAMINNYSAPGVLLYNLNMMDKQMLLSELGELLSNGNAYSYHTNGNMTYRLVNGQVFNLAYDAENRMVQATGAVTETFQYGRDGSG